MSAARVVYDHFGGAERFPGISRELMEASTRPTPRFSEDEILDPAVDFLSLPVTRAPASAASAIPHLATTS